MACTAVCGALAHNTTTCLFVLARGQSHPPGSSGRGGADYDPANIWGSVVTAQQGRSTPTPSPPPQQHQHYQQQQQHQQGMSEPPKAVVSVWLQELHVQALDALLACLLTGLSLLSVTSLSCAYVCCALGSAALTEAGHKLQPALATS